VPAIEAEITDAYRAGLSNMRARALQLVGQLWRSMFNFSTPVASLRAISLDTAGIVTAGQRASQQAAANYLQAGIARATGLERARIEPFAQSPALVGQAANGWPIERITDSATGVYLRRLGDGWSEEDAADSAHAWLNRVTATEPIRVANETVIENLNDDGRYEKRYGRVVSPGACDFCILIANRGYTYEGVRFQAHPNCRCTPGPVITEWYVKSKQEEALERAQRREARRALGTGAVGDIRIETGDGLFQWKEADIDEVRRSLAHALEGIRPDVIANLPAVRGPTYRERKGNALGVFNPPDSWRGSFGGSKDGSIMLNDGIFDPNGEDVFEAMYTNRKEYKNPRYFGGSRGESMTGTWWPETIDPKKISRIQGSLTHEVGHFLDFQLTPEQRDEIMRKINDFGVSEAVVRAREQQGTTGLGYMNTSQNVSAYAWTEAQRNNTMEIFSEAWAEYRLADNPRPFAKMIGDYMMSVLGVQT
jgi:hypothetical protein